MKRIAAFCLVLILSTSSPARSQWLPGGHPISRGADSYVTHDVASDGRGGMIMVWTADYHRILAQRVDSLGFDSWGQQGMSVVDVGPFAGTGAPSVAPDGSGGVIVLWTVPQQFTDGGLYAQRVDADGQLAWAEGGVLVGPTSTSEELVAPDQQGGIFVAWRDLRNAGGGDGGDLYAQHVTANGDIGPGWSVSGVPICQLSSYQIPIALVADGERGFFVCWRDDRDPAAPQDSYLQRFTEGGEPAAGWPVNGLRVSESVSARYIVSLIVDSLGACVVTNEYGASPTPSIYAQRFSLAGVRLWGSTGTLVASGPLTGGSTAVESASGAVVVVWSAGDELRAQKLDPTGSPAWHPAGVIISQTLGARSSLHAVASSAGAALVFWHDERRSVLCAQTISAEGTTKAITRSIAIGRVEFYPRSKAVKGSAGDAYVAWTSMAPVPSSNYEFHTLCQRVLPSGMPGEVIAMRTSIANVLDEPRDQGGWVRVGVPAAEADLLGRGYVTGYNIWRRTDTTSPAIAGAPIVEQTDGRNALQFLPPRGAILTAHVATTLGFPPGSWESLGFHAAMGNESNVFLAPTHTDSVPEGVSQDVFVVTIHSGDPLVVAISDPDSGYSVDNLNPARPTAFRATSSGMGVVLDWVANQERDLREYRLYRGATPNFEPSALTLISTQVSTGFLDPDGSSTSVYKLAAVDIHGNASLLALASPEGPTSALFSLVSVESRPDRTRLVWYAAGNPGVWVRIYRRTPLSAWTLVSAVAADESGHIVYEDIAASPGNRYGYTVGVWNGEEEALGGEAWVDVPQLSFALFHVRPNPAPRGSIVTEFSLPDARPTRLELVDVTGRRMAAQNVGGLGPGRHSVVLRESGLTPGLYFVRLRRDTQRFVEKVAIVR